MFVVCECFIVRKPIALDHDCILILSHSLFIGFFCSSLSIQMCVFVLMWLCLVCEANILLNFACVSVVKLLHYYCYCFKNTSFYANKKFAFDIIFVCRLDRFGICRCEMKSINNVEFQLKCDGVALYQAALELCAHIIIVMGGTTHYQSWQPEHHLYITHAKSNLT